MNRRRGPLNSTNAPMKGLSFSMRPEDILRSSDLRATAVGSTKYMPRPKICRPWFPTYTIPSPCPTRM